MPLQSLQNTDVLKPAELKAVELLYSRLNADNHIRDGFLLPAFQIPGNAAKDCDMLLCLVFKQSYTVNIDGRLCSFSNLFMAVELKSHAEFDVKQGNIFVQYPSGPKNASVSVRQIRDNLKNLLQREQQMLSELYVPWIYHCICFSGISRAASPKGKSRIVDDTILFADEMTLRGIAEFAAGQVKHEQRNDCSSWKENQPGGRMNFDTISNILNFTPLHIRQTSYDRRKIEQFTQRAIEESSSYIDWLGQKTLVFRGPAGTGKTARLLNLGYTLFQAGKRLLLLTFNNALASDLKRLTAIFNHQKGSGAPFELNIMTVESLIFQIAVYVLGSGKEEALSELYAENYELGRQEGLKAIDTVRKDKDADEYRQLILDSFAGGRLDYILIDEGQDWHKEDGEIAAWLAGSEENLIISIAEDQITRKSDICCFSWLKNVKYIECIRNLRQKDLICAFVSEYSRQKKLSNIPARTPDHTDRGHVKIINDKELSEPDFWKNLEQSLETTGNKPVDVLIIEPPSLEEQASVISLFRKNEKQLWNGKSGDKRFAPVSELAYRLVTYETSRGLEGWTVIVRQIDYQYKKIKTKVEIDYKHLPAEQKRTESYNRLRIPLTRAIDTLIITYADEGSALTADLKQYLQTVNC